MIGLRQTLVCVALLAALAACGVPTNDKQARDRYVEQNVRLYADLPAYERATVESTDTEKYDGSGGRGYRTTRVVRFSSDRATSELAADAGAALATKGWSCSPFSTEPSMLGTDGRGVRCRRSGAELVVVYFVADGQRRMSATADHDERLSIE